MTYEKTPDDSPLAPMDANRYLVILAAFLLAISTGGHFGAAAACFADDPDVAISTGWAIAPVIMLLVVLAYTRVPLERIFEHLFAWTALIFFIILVLAVLAVALDSPLVTMSWQTMAALATAGTLLTAAAFAKVGHDWRQSGPEKSETLRVYAVCTLASGAAPWLIEMFS